jgi:enamine deaminase RidA (YjgF/YER057c/UK114 family)
LPWFASGQTASQFDREARKVVVCGDAAEQTRAVYGKLSNVVAGAGLTLADVTHVTEFLPMASASHRPNIERARREALGPANPVVSTCFVQDLLRRGAHLEVEVEAIADPAKGHLMPHRLPTLMPIDDGSVVAPGDSRSQVEWCFDRAAGELAVDGFQLAGEVVTCLERTIDDVAVAFGDLPFSCRGVAEVTVTGTAVSVDCVAAPAAMVTAVAFPGTGPAVGSAVKTGTSSMSMGCGAPTPRRIPGRWSKPPACMPHFARG